MKLASPVHFVAGFVEAIASDAQRMRSSVVASSAFPMPPKFIASICMLQEAKEKSNHCPCTRCSNPTPLGERRRRPRRDGNEDQGNANVQNSGAVWFDELATGPRDRPPKASLDGCHFRAAC